MDRNAKYKHVNNLNGKQMKNKEFIPFVVGIIMLASCSKMVETESSFPQNVKRNPNTDYGSLHNNMISNVEKQYDTTILFCSVIDVINYVDSINQDYIQKTDLPESLKKVLAAAIQSNRESMSYADFYDSIFTGKHSIFNSNSILMDHKLINQTEYEQLSAIARLMYNTSIGNISNRESLNELGAILCDADTTLHTKVGEVVFSIIQYSNDYWTAAGEEPNMPYEYALPPQVYVDAAGAVVGGAMAAGIEYALHGTVSTETVVVGAVANAIDASTGMTTAVAKGAVKAAKIAGKFIKKLIK